MKFAHMADCHIGSWREPVLRDAGMKAFSKAVEICIERKVDFILISGDLFNTSLPAIDKLKEVTSDLKKLKDGGIPVYVIAGSHDFSPSGKTMIDVLEKAGLVANVVKGNVDEKNILHLNFTVDKKTGAKITGMLGKKGMLERRFYENLDIGELEKESGYKIFMFHTAISEFKPEDMDKMESAPLSILPKNFNYYAGGHVHFVFRGSEKGYGTIVYPGALFPNNFRELEKFGFGGFYIIDRENIERIPVKIHDVQRIAIDCENMSPAQANSELMKEIESNDFSNSIVTIRLKGTLAEGRPSDIDFKSAVSRLTEKGAVAVQRNTYSLGSKQFESVRVSGSVESVEEKLLEEHAGQLGIGKEELKKIMGALAIDKADGEKTADFEARLFENASNVILNKTK